MHDLLKHVLMERDLTRAGDLFGIPDADIVNDLNEVLKQITEISSRPDYIRNDRDQALIEICVTRVTSCIKETGTLDKYCGAVVALLESCLHHNLMPVGHLRDDDPPHAKIASDIIACIVLVSFPVQSDKENYNNKQVMELFLPVAVQFLHKGNREISRHMARYLSLAAVHHASLLKPHVQTIMDSIMSGNYPLCRILTNLYEVCPDPLEGHTTALVSLLPHAEQIEKNSLFTLFEQIAVRRPEALKTCVPQLLSYLCQSNTSQNDPGCMCVDILQLIVCVSRTRVSLVMEHGATIRNAARPPHASPRVTALVAAVLTQLGYTQRERAQEALNFVVESLSVSDRSNHAALMREATALCSAYPQLFTDNLLTAVRRNSRPKSAISSEVNRTSGGITIVKLSGSSGTTTGGSTTGVAGNGVSTGATAGTAVTIRNGGTTGTTATPGVTAGYSRRVKLGDSRSTGRLHAAPQRSMTRLNVAGGSVGGLHKSMTRLSSSHLVTAPNSKASTGSVTSGPATSASATSASATSASATSALGMTSASGMMSASGMTSPPRPARPHHHHNIVIGPQVNNVSPPSASLQSHTIPVHTTKSTDMLPSVSIHHNSALGHVSIINSTTQGSGPISLASGPISIPSGPISIPSGPISIPSGPISIPSGVAVPVSGAVTVTSRRANNTSVTMINSSNSTSNHRISVFEPYPMRDTVQHFCEKHLDKIKAYMDHVSLRIPPPAKCTIEERRSKKLARLQFACGRRGPHCLYARTLFSMRTRAPRVWIHLMFLALQARHGSALSSRDPTVASLKHCWDTLKCENKTFLTLVTSAFPGVKEQEMLLNELRTAGFFDVFELNTTRTDGGHVPPTQATWGCFLCNHPERAVGFLAADGAPVIEGQLKEKKGRWRLFRRWRTRYFTLSGAHLSCKGSSGGESIDINQIRSVKVSRGARNIPKAFEIFTGDQTLILKPKDGKNAEQWVQCLSIAVAHSQARDVPAKANSLPARGLTLKSF